MEYWEQIIIAITTGVVVTLVVFSVQYIYQTIQYWRMYTKYEGRYLVYWKSDSEREKAVFETTICVRRNVFKFEGKTLVSGEATEYITGEVEMTQNLPSYGKGYYSQGKGAWGFIEWQIIEGNRIFAHQNYVDNTSFIPQSFIWHKK